MIVGNIYKKCDSCGKSKSLDAFELDITDDDNDPYIKNHSCNDCYQLERVACRESEAERKGEFLIQNRVDFIYKEPRPVIGHAPICPKCDSKTGCGCDDRDEDGYK